MRNLGAEALILDTFDLHERDRIVTFLTAEYGKKRGVARGAKTKYSRFAGQLQPLAKVGVQWFEKEGRDLVSLKEVELIRPAADLHRDLEGILLGAYLAEHMKEFALEDEASEPFFRLLDSTVEALLAKADRRLVARYFECWILRLSGIFPVPRRCPLCEKPFEGKARLATADSALVCQDCAPAAGAGAGLEVGPAEIEFLRRTARQNQSAMLEDPPPAWVLDRIEEICARIRRQFLQDELRSYRVMGQTLASLPNRG